MKSVNDESSFSTCLYFDIRGTRDQKKQGAQSAGRKHWWETEKEVKRRKQKGISWMQREKDKEFWKDEGNWRIRKGISLFSSGLCKRRAMPPSGTHPVPLMFPNVRVLPEQVLFLGNRKVSLKASVVTFLPKFRHMEYCLKLANRLYHVADCRGKVGTYFFKCPKFHCKLWAKAKQTDCHTMAF